MNLGRFIVRNALRNKRRTALTFFSVGFSLFLLIVLFTVLDMLLHPPMTEESVLRLAVRRATSLADNLPIAYLQKVEKVPHVTLAMPLQFFGGVYKDPENFFANFGIDPVKFPAMFPEIELTPEAQRAFAQERTGAIVGTGLMKKFGWKVGDRVTLIGTFFPVSLEFKIVGTFSYELAKNNFYFNWYYLNEAMDDWGQVGALWVKADSAAAVPVIADAIDTLFHNTAAETKTETEKAFMLGFVSMLGNIRMIIGSISMVVIFTLLLVSTSTMSMTIRERMREVAILKSMGYTRRTLLFLVLGESVFIAMLGLATGIGLAQILSEMDIATMTQGFIQFFKPTPQIYASVVLIGLGIGILSGIGPAISAANKTIAEAMRQLE